MKWILLLLILVCMVGLGSASWGGYGLGDEYYGLTYHYDSQETVVPSGGYLPYQPSYVKVIDDGVLYASNLSGGLTLFCAYNFTSNDTKWCADVVTYDGIQPYFPYITEEDGNVLVAGTNKVEFDETGTELYNYTAEDYFYWISLTPYATPYYNNNTHMGLYFKDEVISTDRYYWMDVQLKYYNQSGDKILQPNNLMGYNFAGYRTYQSTANDPQDLGAMNKPIYDKTNNYIIQVTERSYQQLKNNLTYVLSDPNIKPLHFNQGCWVDSSCGANGTGYYVKCSIAGTQNTTPYSCVNDGQCTGSANTYCRYVEAEGMKKCVSSDIGGVCQMALKDPCLITIPTTQFQHAFTYDYLTKMLYLYVRDGSNMIIYNQDVSQCVFDGNTKLTASLFGSYGQGVSSIGGEGVLSQSPIMDDNYIYITWNNATGYYFQKIDRITKAVVYGRILTKDIYNSSMSGNIGGTNAGYIGYDISTKDVYVFVDTNKFIKFGQINYTVCPNEDPHIADPMCYTNGTLDLINHQYCDTDISPTEIQPCTDKLELSVSCNRDWQCVNEAVQGWCAIDINDTCAARGSALDYNCTTGILSWAQAGNPDSGSFYAYIVTSGSQSSLFDSYSVEQNLIAINYNQTQSYTIINLSSNLFYNVIAANSENKEYWKTDIIKGSDVLPTTTTTTSTTSTSTTSTSTSTTTTTIFNPLYGGYNLIVSTCGNNYNLNDSLGCYKAYFSKNYVYIPTASCIPQVDDSVFSHGTFSNMVYYSSGSPPYYSWDATVRVKDNQSAKDVMVNVSCTNNSITITNWTIVHINGFIYGGNPLLEFITTLPDGVIYTAHDVVVRFKFDNGNLIENASCVFYVDGGYESDMIEQSNHLYNTSYIYPIWTGLHDYEVRCNRSDTGFANKTGYFTIYESYNFTSTTNPPQQCPVVGVVRYDITGCNDDTYDVTKKKCKSDHTLEITSTHISCIGDNEYCNPSNIGRADQTFDDVADSCNALPSYTTTTNPQQVCSLSPPDCSLCVCNDPYTQYNADGSCLCNSSSLHYYYTSCISNGECNFTYTIHTNIGYTVKTFRCRENYCRFAETEQIPNASTTQSIYALSNIIYNDGTENLYIGVCEDNTNGFRVETQNMTHTTYQIITSDYGYGSSLSAMGYPKTFGSDGKSKSAVLPEMCSWSSGDHRYGTIEFISTIGGTNENSRIIEALVLKNSFKVSVNPTTLNNLLFNLTRNGTCFAKTGSLDPYTQINIVPATSIIFNKILLNLTNDTLSTYWMCNSTYNEVRTGSYGESLMWMVGWLLWSIILIFLSLFGITEIVWQGWYTLLVIFGLMIIVPLLYLILRDRGR